jgi:hypothetical protein
MDRHASLSVLVVLAAFFAICIIAWMHNIEYSIILDKLNLKISYLLDVA